MPYNHIETSQTGFQGVAHEEYENVKIHRLYEDRPIDKSHYMMTWFAEVHAGEPVVGHYFGPTVVYVVEGEFNVEDKSKPGQISKLVTGDVLNIDEASYVTWTSPNKGKCFAVSYSPTTSHPENLVQPAKK